MTLTPLPDFRLDGKRALITGGGRGIGAAGAEIFAQAGAAVTLCGRTAADLDATVRLLEGFTYFADELVGALERL